jgi:hypothetical protein
MTYDRRNDHDRLWEVRAQRDYDRLVDLRQAWAEHDRDRARHRFDPWPYLILASAILTGLLAGALVYLIAVIPWP